MTTKTKIIAVLFLITATLSINTANAQTIDNDKLRFGIGVDGLIPVGDLSNSEGFGLGITPRLQYGLSNNLALTFTSGIYHFFPKTVYIHEQTPTYTADFTGRFHLDIVPVTLGIKAFITKNIYLTDEAGAGFEVEDGGGPVKILLSTGAGYANKHWDFGLKYENFSGEGTAYGVLNLRVAYGFGL